MRSRVIDIYQLGKGYKPISNASGLQQTTMRAIIQNREKFQQWWILAGVAGLPKLLQKCNDNSTWRSQKNRKLHASLPLLKVSVHESTIGKSLGKKGFHGRGPRRKPLLTKRNTKVHITFLKMFLQDFWESIRWTDETKAELVGRLDSCYIWSKTN